MSGVLDHQSDVVIFHKLNAGKNIVGSGDSDRVTDIVTELASSVCGSVWIA